jgi:hypothetical protein
LRQGIALAKGLGAGELVSEPEREEAPAAERTFERRVGGSTMSRSAFGEVVRGCPIESRVSSRSYGIWDRSQGLDTELYRRTDLVDDVEVVAQLWSRHLAKVLGKDVDESLEECERIQRVDYAR